MQPMEIPVTQHINPRNRHPCFHLRFQSEWFSNRISGNYRSMSANITEEFLPLAHFPSRCFSRFLHPRFRSFCRQALSLYLAHPSIRQPTFFLTIEDLTSLRNDQSGVLDDGSTKALPALVLRKSGNAVRLEGVMTVVPAPASIWLFASGVAGLFGVNNRRRLLRKAG